MAQIAEVLSNNHFFKTLFEAMPSGVVLIDESLNIQMVNDNFVKSLETSGSRINTEILNSVLTCEFNVENPTHCGEKDRCLRCKLYTLAKMALAGKPIKRQRVQLPIRIGDTVKERVLLISTSPLEFAEKKYALLIIEDITSFYKLQRELKAVKGFSGIVGQDIKMLELYDTISDLAEIEVPVLIEGESGTGKELVAHAIHNLGPRTSQPFVPVNCGALPETLLESELFGHVKGAFTGAIRDKRGRFELADGGSIFLDEIGDVSPRMQVKLLRVLQEGTFERVGSERTTKVDVRVISATNRTLRDEIAAGRFREDLYYRLAVMPITVPPLRERKSDVPLIAQQILRTSIMRSNGPKIQISEEAMKVMIQYSWPGNVRELQNAIQYALVKVRGDVIDIEHLPPTLMQQFPSGLVLPTPRKRRRKLDILAVRQALKQSGGNKASAAKKLGVARATLYRFLEFADLEDERQ